MSLPGDGTQAPITVLVLEDSLLIALAIEAGLADRGFAVTVAGSLAAAQERLSGGVPQLAVLDLQLPDGSSLALARWLHDRGCTVAICTGTDTGDILPPPAFARCFQKPVSAEVIADWAAAAAVPPG